MWCGKQKIYRKNPRQTTFFKVESNSRSVRDAYRPIKKKKSRTRAGLNKLLRVKTFYFCPAVDDVCGLLCDASSLDMRESISADLAKPLALISISPF